MQARHMTVSLSTLYTSPTYTGVSKKNKPIDTYARATREHLQVKDFQAKQFAR